MAKVKAKDGKAVQLMYDGQIYSFMVEPTELEDRVADFFCAKYTNVERVTEESTNVTADVKVEEAPEQPKEEPKKEEVSEIPIVLDNPDTSKRRGKRS